MKIKLLMLCLFTLLQGCSKVDDYMLGKDNTPKPKDLKQIDSKVVLAQKWTAPIGRAHKSNEYLKLKPVSLNQLIYTADASGLIQAVSERDGQIKWSTQLKQGLVSGPSLGQGFIAVSTNTASVVVLNQSDGKVLWRNKVSGEVLSPPAISHHKVIVKTIDGKVFVFNAADGKSVWTAEHGAPSLVLKASSSPVVLGELVLIGFSDGKLDAFDLNTGRLVWQRSIAYSSGSSDVERLVDIDADPIVKNNIAYIGSYQGYIGALSLTDGQFIWRKPGSVYKNMLLDSGHLYLTDSHDVLWSLDARTGHVNWKQTGLKARGLTDPVRVGSLLVVGDKTGYLHVIETDTGELVARSQLSGAVSVSPSVVGRNLYVITDNGMLNKLSVS